LLVEVAEFLSQVEQTALEFLSPEVLKIIERRALAQLVQFSHRVRNLAFQLIPVVAVSRHC
jgi:hypothetical protein